MEMLMVTRAGQEVNPVTGLVSYWVQFDPAIPAALEGAVVAANINILRRSAPYAYLFAGGYSLLSWRAEDIGDDLGYVATLDVRELPRTVFPANPSADFELQTVVVAILSGDVLPIVHLLKQEEFALLLLPAYTSLQQIVEAVGGAHTNAEAVKRVVGDRGCFVTYVDGTVFRIMTACADFGRYLDHGVGDAVYFEEADLPGLYEHMDGSPEIVEAPWIPPVVP